MHTCGNARCKKTFEQPAAMESNRIPFCSNECWMVWRQDQSFQQPHLQLVQSSSPYYPGNHIRRH